MIKQISFKFFIIFIFSVSYSFAEDVKKSGKYKDWETMVLVEASTNTIVSQSLYFPDFLTSSAKEYDTENIKIIKNLKDICLIMGMDLDKFFELH